MTSRQILSPPDPRPGDQPGSLNMSNLSAPARKTGIGEMRAALEKIVGRLGVSDLGTLGRDTTLQWCVQVFWRLSGQHRCERVFEWDAHSDVFRPRGHCRQVAELTSSAHLVGRVAESDDRPTCGALAASLQLRGVRARQHCWSILCYFCRAGHSAYTVVICDDGVPRRTLP